MKAVLGSLLLVGLVRDGEAAPLKAWSVAAPGSVSAAGGARDIRAARMAGAKSVAVDHAAMAASARQAAISTEGTTMNFDLPGGSVSCVMGRSEVLAPGLAAKYPNVVALSGSCGEEGSASLVMDTAREGSFSATVHSASQGVHYVDNVGAGAASYRMYSYSDAQAMSATFAASEQWRCGTTSSTRRLGEEGQEGPAHDEELRSSSSLGSTLRSLRAERRAQASPQVYKFRMALIANKEYSQYHGNTKSRVLTEMAALLSRVNGVYLRELSSFFTLIDGVDKLICLSGDSSCASWPNDSSLLNRNEGIISGVGITTAQYDIGHSVSTGAGGVAGYPSFCTGSKARGTTGTTQPTNDPYWIDFVAHELGHQLSGAHSFRDCDGQNDGNFMSEGAVEPGSGTTIMGYAGICGSRDVQKFSDPYFNSNNLVAMRALIRSRASGGCGVATAIPNGAVSTVSVPATCTLPKGNFLQLNGALTNNAQETQMRFAWDRVDTGFRDFTVKTTADFRPWTPTKSTRRFLPNMYYLTFRGPQIGEVAPLASIAGDEKMTFRFIARTRYVTTATAPSFDISMAGTFGYADTAVTFSKAHTPLLITSQPSALASGQSLALTWTGAATLTSNVEALVALVSMVNRTRQADFKYETDVKDLEWVSLGVVPNNGAATLTVPALPGATEGAKVNLMLRSVGTDSCYFFDLRPLIAYSSSGAVPTAPTTPAPAPTTAKPTTAMPTTAAPTTAKPTTAAPTTAKPTTAAPTTAAPTTAAPTTAAPGTPIPTSATTAQPTATAPTSTSTALPTALPTTGRPTTSSTTQPTVKWQCTNSWFGARDGCDCECSLGRTGNTESGAANVDPDCLVSGQRLYCNGRAAASGITCDLVIDKCVTVAGKGDENANGSNTFFTGEVKPEQPEQPQPQPQPQAATELPLAAIFGGAGGVLAVVAVGSALVVRRRRTSAAQRSATGAPSRALATGNPAYAKY
jgi:hypothetical protein